MSVFDGIDNTDDFSPFQESMGSGLTLPFTAPMVVWHGGDPQFASNPGASGVLHFGGWKIDTQEYESVDPPVDGTPKLHPETFHSDSGAYDVMATRELFLAPFGKRECFDQEKRRSRLHVLAYSGIYSKEESRIVPWTPVWIATTSYHGVSLKNAISQFASRTSRARREHAKNLPPTAFWHRLGTFGDELKREKRGSNIQNWITPVQVQMMDNIDLDWLTRAYVGKETLEEMLDLLKQAEQWLKAWDNIPESTQAGIPNRTPTRSSTPPPPDVPDDLDDDAYVPF